MALQTVSSTSRVACRAVSRMSLTLLAFCAMPLLAQSSNPHDEHAMHAPAAAKPKVTPVDATSNAVDSAHADHSGHESMDHGDSAKPSMDHSDHVMETDAPVDHANHQSMDHGEHAAEADDDMATMDHSQHQGLDHAAKVDGDMAGMDHGSMDMQGGSAPSDARDPDYSDGVEAAHMHGMHMHGATYLGSVIVDNLEAFSGNGSHGQSLDMQAWYGGDIDKLWFKAEGERSDGHLGKTRVELLWDRAISAYWGGQLGIRHDAGEGPSRDWVAFGVQGLAPYWFEVEATAYVGDSGRTALRLEAEYELMLTQRLILQPDVELNFYGKDDPARGIGSGLSDLDVGLRLRYEFTRKFAPYVGVTWSRKFGKTADFARAEGAGADDTQLVAGVRLWF